METSESVNPEKECSICNLDKGKLTKEYCRDNPKHPNYEYDMDDGLTYLDCWSFIRSNETKDEYNQRIKNRGN